MIINGYVDLSGLYLSSKDPLSKSLTKIRKISEHCENLSNLLFSYIQQSNEKPEYVQIQFLVKKTLAFLQILLPRKIKIREKINKGDDTILAHPVQIQQVIVNLGINAMHAMGNEGGIIEVSLEKIKLDTTSMKCLDIKTRDCIKFSMKDTGCGMDEKTLEQIFKTFYSTREKGKGSGLGLSITHDILKNHGGGIKVESLLGKGSSFHVYLPIIDKSHKN
jgi:signal transduction histidine kinase